MRAISPRKSEIVEVDGLGSVEIRRPSVRSSLAIRQLVADGAGEEAYQRVLLRSALALADEAIEYLFDEADPEIVMRLVQAVLYVVLPPDSPGRSAVEKTFRPGSGGGVEIPETESDHVSVPAGGDAGADS